MNQCFQSMGRDPNKGHEGSKNGSCRGDPKLNCVFATLPACLCLSVVYRYFRKDYISDFGIELSVLPKVTNTFSIFNTMFASWVAGCTPHSGLGRPRKS